MTEPLEKVKLALDQLLAELNGVKATICVLLVYVETELEKENNDKDGKEKPG